MKMMMMMMTMTTTIEVGRLGFKRGGEHRVVTGISKGAMAIGSEVGIITGKGHRNIKGMRVMMMMTMTTTIEVGSLGFKWGGNIGL